MSTTPTTSMSIPSGSRSTAQTRIAPTAIRIRLTTSTMGYHTAVPVLPAWRGHANVGAVCAVRGNRQGARSARPERSGEEREAAVDDERVAAHHVGVGAAEERDG